MPADHDVLERGHTREQPDVLERAGDAEGADLVSLEAPELLTVEGHRAFGRLVDTGEKVEERGLAGTVRTDEGDDLALVDVQVDVRKGLEAPEHHRHLVSL